MSDFKSLLIKSNDTRSTTPGKWDELTQAGSYIKGIETPATTEAAAETLNSMITGIPSIWARTRMFQYAFEHSDDKVNSSLLKLYKDIIDEWKGLIGVLAIFPDRITIKSNISLGSKNQDVFSIPAGFGRLLFEDTDLWCDPGELEKSNKKDPRPFTQLIYYNDVLVGATSPYTLVFTSVDYSNLPSGDIPWFRNGKFEDPLKYNPSSDNLQRILICITNIKNNLSEFYKDINKNREGKEHLGYKSLQFVCEQMINEISRQDIKPDGTLGELRFASPFYNIFNFKQTFFFGEGRFSKNPGAGFHEIDTQKLLLESESIYLIPENNDQKRPYSDVCAYLLKINSGESNFYAPVPLSQLGLQVFFHQIGDLLSGTSNSGDFSNLIASINKDRLKVELHLKIDGRPINPITKEYSIFMLTEVQRSIIMWPGFVSKEWKHYYIYSEFPSNHRSIRGIPFFKQYNEEKKRYELVVSDSDELVTHENKSSEIKIDQLIRYPVDTASADDWPYEIIRSDQPFAGIELRMMISGMYKSCGYLVIKRPEDQNTYLPIKDLNNQLSFENVTLGIDFGSNNTAISYSVNKIEEAQPLTFKNQRRFLLGTEIIDSKHLQVAQKNELLFFQNEEPSNGQIKSWIHDHKDIYSQNNQKEEIAGGVPVFEPNIMIHDMDNRMIRTNAGIMHYNTKWLTDIKGQEKKEAFLRSVVLMAAASLFADNKKVSKIKWSFPGSFSSADVRQYDMIFNGFKSPYRSSGFENPESTTEAEAVSNYVLNNRDFAGDNLLLGIDVGGSTSDIMIIAGDRELRRYVFKKQSSLRLAAGILSDVILKSSGLRETLLSFHGSADCSFKVAGIETMKSKPQTSPFYLNAILDRLQGEEDFKRFYWYVAGKNPEVFVIPAFLCGLLLYYSGKLVASVMKNMPPQMVERIKRVDFFCFGKGGKIFEWLYVFPGETDAEKYFHTCFNEGLGEEFKITLDLSKRKELLNDTKLEVAKGLTARSKIALKQDELSAIRNESDIIGEKGFKYHPQGGSSVDLMWDTTATEDYFNDIAFALEPPSDLAEFNRFLGIFLNFISKFLREVNTKQLDNLKKEVYKDLITYISADPEYIKAMKSKESSNESCGFRHSLLIYEGMCYLHKHLIPNLFR